MNIEQAIKKDCEKTKKTVLKKAIEKGIYENLGQKEINKLTSKYSEYRYKQEFKPITELDNFFMNLDDNNLKELIK